MNAVLRGCRLDAINQTYQRYGEIHVVCIANFYDRRVVRVVVAPRINDRTFFDPVQSIG